MSARLVALLLLAVLCSAVRAQAPDEQCVNVIVTGDGYTAAKEGDFNSFADQVEKKLFEIEPYKRMKQFFKLNRVFKPSKEDGITRWDAVIPSTPGEKERCAAMNPEEVTLPPDIASGTYHLPAAANNKALSFKDKRYVRDTVWGVELKARGKKPIWGYKWDDAQETMEGLPSLPDKAYDDLKALAKEKGLRVDLVIILTPDKEIHAAAANYKCPGAVLDRPFAVVMITSSDIDNFDTVAQTMTHELGHAVYTLGDEYVVDSGCDISALAYFNIANIDIDPKKPKWQHLIDLGIIRNDPIQGGLMSCPTEVYHPTPSCKMNTNTPPFCPACMERVSHAHSERAKLILSASPGGRIVQAPEDHIHYVVRTCAKDIDAACTPRYLEYWEIDGIRITAGPKSHIEAAGYVYEYDIIKLPLGTHRLRFTLGDGQLICDHAPDMDQKGERRAMPWDTTDWWILVLPERVLDPLGIGLLMKKVGWD